MPKSKSGRPRKAAYVPFMFRMPEQMNYELTFLSMQSGFTRSELVRRAVGDYLNRLKADRAEGGPGKGYKVVE